MNCSLEGRIALVTGAARGIGRACALELAAQGADVVINDIGNGEAAEDTAREVRRNGRRAMVVVADVANRAAVEGMIERTVQELGGLDIVIANAGRNVRRPFLEMEEKDFAATLDVTLWGAFHVSQFGARQMVKQKRAGSIVFISSVHAVMALPNAVAYNAAKAGLNHMARSIAAELAPYGIRANIIEPGWIDTPGERITFSAAEIEHAGKQLPFGRLGSAEEIAKGAAFLASDDASYVTGTTLRIDGGFVLPRVNKGSC